MKINERVFFWNSLLKMYRAFLRRSSTDASKYPPFSRPSAAPLPSKWEELARKEIKGKDVASTLVKTVGQDSMKIGYMI